MVYLNFPLQKSGEMTKARQGYKIEKKFKYTCGHRITKKKKKSIKKYGKILASMACKCTIVHAW